MLYVHYKISQIITDNQKGGTIDIKLFFSIFVQVYAVMFWNSVINILKKNARMYTTVQKFGISNIFNVFFLSCTDQGYVYLIKIQ